MLRLTRAMMRSRKAAVGVITAIVAPAMSLLMAGTIEFANIEVQNIRLQAAADAGSAAGREALDPTVPDGEQVDTVNEQAELYANQNYDSSVGDPDVVQGWWDTTTQSFGPPVADSALAEGGSFSFDNAVQVVAHTGYTPLFGTLLGIDTLTLSRQAVAYKCSNYDNAVTRIPDDPDPPAAPRADYEYSVNGSPVQSWYYLNPDTGDYVPVVKMYSNVDTPVNFRLKPTNFTDYGTLYQSLFCRGTYLVALDYPGDAYSPSD